MICEAIFSIIPKVPKVLRNGMIGPLNCPTINVVQAIDLKYLKVQLILGSTVVRKRFTTNYLPT